MVTVGNRELPTRNGEGYLDTTAYEAVRNATAPTNEECERFNKLLYSIKNICELSGFRIEGRLILVDKETNRVWR